MDQHDVMMTSQIYSYPCSHVGLPLGHLLLVVGHPLRPPLLTLLPQFWHLFIQVTTQPSLVLYSTSGVSVRVWEC